MLSNSSFPLLLPLPSKSGNHLNRVEMECNRNIVAYNRPCSSTEFNFGQSRFLILFVPIRRYNNWSWFWNKQRVWGMKLNFTQQGIGNGLTRESELERGREGQLLEKSIVLLFLTLLSIVPDL